MFSEEEVREQLEALGFANVPDAIVKRFIEKLQQQQIQNDESHQQISNQHKSPARPASRESVVRDARRFDDDSTHATELNQVRTRPNSSFNLGLLTHLLISTHGIC